MTHSGPCDDFIVEIEFTESQRKIVDREAPERCAFMGAGKYDEERCYLCLGMSEKEAEAFKSRLEAWGFKPKIVRNPNR